MGSPLHPLPLPLPLPLLRLPLPLKLPLRRPLLRLPASAATALFSPELGLGLGSSRSRMRMCTAFWAGSRGRSFSTSRPARVDFTHAVIGGGAVGLAIARQLASRPGTSTILIERHGMVGSETSSRNSEVIHAGLYYGPDSLKTKLCIRGKQLLYELCAAQQIPHRRTKKWILAQDAAQMAELARLHDFSKTIDVPTRFLSRREIHDQEPDVRADAGVLESPTTGIVDSHALMAYLEGSLDERGGQEILNTEVTKIEVLGKTNTGTNTTNNTRTNTSTGTGTTNTTTTTNDSTNDSTGTGTGTGRTQGYAINTNTTTNTTTTTNTQGYAITTRSRTRDGALVDEDTITAETVINSAGLGAVSVSNMLLPPARHRTPFYAKGSYFSYTPSPSSGDPKPKTLLYPAPVPGLGGLGTHLTLDMAGRVRFGPDVEWVDDPTDLTPSQARLDAAVPVIQTYLPGVRRDALALDYCGIRPKLARSSGTYGVDGKGFADFYIREEEGFPGFVNLLGIESPGLTASLAIAELVDRILYAGGDQRDVG